MVASRLHGIILSLIAGCPVVAVGHMAKVGSVMHQLGFDEFSLSLQNLNDGTLSDAVLKSLGQTERLRCTVSSGCALLRSELAGTFDALAALARSSRSRSGQPGSGDGSRARPA